MILGRVVSEVVSTFKDKTFEGRKILVVQPVSGDKSLLAFDEVQAGPGDTVLVCREGNGCRQIWGMDQAPVNSVIVGIVDDYQDLNNAP